MNLRYRIGVEIYEPYEDGEVEGFAELPSGQKVRLKLGRCSCAEEAVSRATDLLIPAFVGGELGPRTAG